MRSLLVILLITSFFGCKNMYLSMRGKGKEEKKTEGETNPAPVRDEVKNGVSAETAVPVVPENEFVIEEPAADAPLEGLIRKRPEGGIEVGGSVAGTWDKNLSPVYVMSDLTLGPDKTLVIKAGVSVVFQGKYRLSVEGGQLKIIGSVRENVVFRAENKAQGWSGIRLCPNEDCQQEEPRGRLEVRFASFEDARKDNPDPNDNTWRRGGVFYIRGLMTAVIEDSLLRNNLALERGGAVEIIADNRNVIFRRNTLQGNSNEGLAGGGGGALLITHGRLLTIESNMFIGNKSKGEGGALYLLDSSGIYLRNNVFRDNVATGTAGAIRCDGHAGLINIEASNTMSGNVPNDITCDP